MSFTATSEGGEYKHSLTANEMPSHDHVLDLYFSESDLGDKQSVESWSAAVIEIHKNKGDELTLYHTSLSTGYAGTRTYDSGGNQKHNNVSPYITVFFWKRVI